MSDEIVKVEDGGVKLALSRFAQTIRQRSALLRDIAASMLVSVRRTFDEQGVPADSWAPLAESTKRRDGSKASSGRKILILSGRLLNSIQATSDDSSVTIGTNLVYARVQQLGSGDGAAAVSAHSRTFLRELYYGTRAVTGADGADYNVPTAMRNGRHDVFDRNGKQRTVRAAYQGPRLQQQVAVEAHERHQNIPARPYLVLRPEDPDRIRGLVIAHSVRSALQAGLRVGGTA